MVGKIYKLEDYEKHKDEKVICVQIQLNQDKSHCEKELTDYITSKNLSATIFKDNSDDTYFNLNFYSKNIKKLWESLKPLLFDSAELGDWIKNVSLIVCEGENGWDDYLMLWCLGDKNEELDEL